MKTKHSITILDWWIISKNLCSSLLMIKCQRHYKEGNVDNVSDTANIYIPSCISTPTGYIMKINSITRYSAVISKHLMQRINYQMQVVGVLFVRYCLQPATSCFGGIFAANFLANDKLNLLEPKDSKHANNITQENQTNSVQVALMTYMSTVI